MLASLAGLFVPEMALPKWYKGNTHSHSVNSDGDSSPDEVARWYKEHGYNFVVLTDHNFNTDVRGINALLAAREKYLVLSGEEVTDVFKPDADHSFPLHLNALNIGQRDGPRTIAVAGGAGRLEILQKNAEAIDQAGALPQVNHPNFGWAVGVDELFGLKNCLLFELRNVSTDCNNLGGGGLPGTEALWDSVLTRGRLVFGVASDDAHEFKVWGSEYSNPGGGFIRVRADSLEAGALMESLKKGDFYSSTGVTLTDVKITDSSYTVEVEENGRTRYTTFFIGRGGKLLAEISDNPAVYRYTGRESYVRAKVVDSNGREAWTQPHFTGAEKKPGTR